MLPESVFDKRELCSGCGACMNACLKNAITMEYAKDGYLYPVIDRNKCVQCGVCRKRCQYIDESFSPDTFSDKEMDIYAAHGDKYAMEKSTSGGLFYVLAKYVIENDGVVYGAVYDKNMVVKHTKAEFLEDVEPMRISKYVQSDTGNTFMDARDELNLGRLVLYSGTPCQLAGLYSYLGRDYDNLISVGLICYGITAPKMFAEYVDALNKEVGSKLKFYDFRNKKEGWGNKWVRLCFADESKNMTLPGTEVTYSRLFASKNANRPSCNNCRYASMTRYTDFAIGDYWKIEDTDAKIDSYDGLSKVFVCSEKGRRYFDDIKGRLVYEKMPYDTAVRPNLCGKSKPSENYDAFQADYAKHGFKYVMKKYFDKEI